MLTKLLVPKLLALYVLCAVPNYRRRAAVIDDHSEYRYETLKRYQRSLQVLKEHATLPFELGDVLWVSYASPSMLAMSSALLQWVVSFMDAEWVVLWE